MLTVNQETCKGCGLCAKICPRHVTVISEESGEKRAVVFEERRELCLKCGQCAALCKQGAISVDGLDPDGYEDAREPNVNYEQMLAVLKQRRSVRQYKDKEIPREILDKILDAVAVSPAISGSEVIGVSVITGGDKMRGLTGLGYSMYGGLEKKLKNPFIHFVMKRKAGERKVHMLENFVMPAMKWYIKWFEEERRDELRRDCQVVMLFHCDTLEPSGDEACMLAAFHAVLAAETLGVGTCINGLFPPFINRTKEIRQTIGLPDNHEVYAALTLGYPKYKFKKTIPRKLGQVRFIEWE
ncbi:MAG: 4Fe-4S dicluster domain-containing protein [Deltaproteobacteria bacterium]|nr:4Fe-4S dicluster domain-containing protein [Deltaproteobacteria bacterium]